MSLEDKIMVLEFNLKKVRNNLRVGMNKYRKVCTLIEDNKALEKRIEDEIVLFKSMRDD